MYLAGSSQVPSELDETRPFNPDVESTRLGRFFCLRQAALRILQFTDSVSDPDLLIRILYFRVKTDPDPIRVQGFDDRKSKKFIAEFLFVF